MKNLWKALLMVRRCDPWSFRRRLLYELLQSLLPLLSLYILKLLIDSVTNPESNISLFNFQFSPFTLLLALCLVFLLNRIVSALSSVNNDVLSQRLIDHVSDLLQRQSARLDMQYYDTPAYHDTLHRAQQEASYRPLQIMTNFMALGGSMVSIIGVVAMLLTASWWVIVVMVAAVLPGFAVRLYKARRIYRFRRENTQSYRRTAYYSAILTAREFAKELRTFNLAPLFRGRFVEVRKQLVGRLLSISRRLGMLDILCAFIEAAAMFAIVWLLLDQAFAGAITIGTFVMLFEAFRRGQGYLRNLVGGIAGLYDNRLFIGNLFEFLSLKPTIVDPVDAVEVPGEITQVEFRNITFRYPDMDRDVLKDFSLTARKGQITRIDGYNGFGKSTLVKLLLRLYDPDAGSVLLDGIDIRRFQPRQLRGTIGVLFQDFARFNCTMTENVSFGTPDGEADIQRALALSGADKVADRLPKGVDTLLGRLFDGGSELSMGQWQRVALARALASDAPILILDEPSAWLDHDARGHLDETLQKLKEDKIIIIITHSQQ
ncbi:MAG: ABC transporter ATP-binding protein [Bacteroidales bacterium]|nr:ABC transporter ATP-binding protein [Bacteroidales bacterium]